MTLAAGGRSPAAFVSTPLTLVPPVTRDWEGMWAPYDPPTYNLVLSHIAGEDVVYEIGAGDLRLARNIAAIARQVYAIEINAGVLAAGLQAGPLPDNLIVLHGDARTSPVPEAVSVGVLLMRHCTHFRRYAHILASAGCARLATNARWGMGVEVIDLLSQRAAYADLPMGWYACECGATGFKTGPAQDWTLEQDALVSEVCGCPKCTERDP